MLYLASRSPRRRALLRQLRRPFRVVASAYRETIRPHEPPSANAMRNAIGKASRARLPRGALGNPWLYREVEAALAGASAPASPSGPERKAVALRHLQLQAQHDAWPVGPLRRILSWYVKDAPGVAEFRNRINRAPSVEELRAALEAFAPLK